jgi:hypothetical protein
MDAKPRQPQRKSARPAPNIQDEQRCSGPPQSQKFLQVGEGEIKA